MLCDEETGPMSDLRRRDQDRVPDLVTECHCPSRLRLASRSAPGWMEHLTMPASRRRCDPAS
jgi:hypothetical protein